MADTPATTSAADQSAASAPLSVVLMADRETFDRFGPWLRYAQLGLADELMRVVVVTPDEVGLEFGITNTSKHITFHVARWRPDRLAYDAVTERVRDAATDARSPRRVIVHVLSPALDAIAGHVGAALSAMMVRSVTSERHVQSLTTQQVHGAAIVAASDRLRSALCTRFPDATNRMRVVRFGVAVDERPPVTIAPDRSTVFLCVGPFGAEANATALVDAIGAAVDRGHDAMLFVVNAGSAETGLWRAASARGLDQRVTLVDSIDVASAMRGAHVWCVPEPARDCGTSTLRAMRTGLCVLAAAGAVEDAVIESKTAICFPAGDPARLREAVLRLLEKPDDTQRIAAAGQAWVRDQHNLSGSITQLVNWYRETADRLTPTPPIGAGSTDASPGA